MSRDSRRVCSHCNHTMRGMASLTTPDGEFWLCRPDLGLDCYYLVTICGHDLSHPCTQCPPEATP